MTLVDFERASVRWARRLALIGGWLLLAVAGATVVDALLRYLLGRPLPGTFEATELLLAAIIFFGLPYTTLIDGHVSVDLLSARLPSRLQHLLVALTDVVVAGLFALITLQLVSLGLEFQATARTTITARIPQFPFVVPVIAAAALSTGCAALHAAGAVARALRPGFPPLGVSA